MKQLRSSVIVNFSFGLLFLSLLMPAAMAQQEIAPERFDRSWGTAQPHTRLSHHKTTESPEASRARKAGSATASRTRRRPRKHPDQSASRQVIEPRG